MATTLPSHSLQHSSINVAGAERWASAIGGAALTAYGISNRSAGGALLAFAGGALIYRGATGHCPVYAAGGINTAARTDTKYALGGPRGSHVDEAVTIDASAPDLYRFWRDLEKLPCIMQNLVSVERLSEWKSRWVARGPGGRHVHWEAEIVSDVPAERIGWRTLEDSDVVSAGSVSFKPAPGGRGTEVRVHLQYSPPAGKAGAAIAWLLGSDPAAQIREDLRRFKQLMEAGEIPTAAMHPGGGR